MTAFEPIIARKEPWTPGRGSRRLLSRFSQKSGLSEMPLHVIVVAVLCVTVGVYSIHRLQASLIKAKSKLVPPLTDRPTNYNSFFLSFFSTEPWSKPLHCSSSIQDPIFRPQGPTCSPTPNAILLQSNPQRPPRSSHLDRAWMDPKGQATRHGCVYQRREW